MIPHLCNMARRGFCVPETEDKAGEGHNSKAIDWSAAARIIENDIADIDGKLAKSRGDMAAAKKRLEDIGVNKRGANFIASLLKAGPSTTSDILRTVVMLAHEIDEIGIIADMVDDAEGQKAFTIPTLDPGEIEVDE